MKKIEINCPAKVNLFLNILNNNKDIGLHDLVLINQTVSLFDEITIYELTKGDMGIKIISKDNIPLDSTNSAYKACQLFFDYTGIHPNTFIISINKNIPNEAGLGGESTDAAGVLIGLNDYYHTNLSKKELMTLGFKVGSDVPYFIHSGYALVTNYGLNVKRLNNNPYKYYLLIKPNFGLKTSEMFQDIDKYPFVEQISRYNNFHNDFEKIMPDELKSLKEYLNQFKEYIHSLSGSGSTYFVASKKPISSTISNNLRKDFPNYKLYKCEATDKIKTLVKYTSKYIK